jgi:hypothetical protein
MPMGMGIIATALWLMVRVEALGALAEPSTDRGALERDMREASKRRAVRPRHRLRLD